MNGLNEPVKFGFKIDLKMIEYQNFARPRHGSGGYSIPLLFSKRSMARSLYRDR